MGKNFTRGALIAIAVILTLDDIHTRVDDSYYRGYNDAIIKIKDVVKKTWNIDIDNY